MTLSNEEIRRRMGYHRATFPSGYDPDGDKPLADFVLELTEDNELATAPVHARLRRIYIETAQRVSDITPHGREYALAMTTLQESLMWANAAVAMEAPLVSE
jgi:hypothetical protein